MQLTLMDAVHEAMTDATEISLPAIIEQVRVPPIKCQGIKTKLVPFILSSITWNGHGRWIEPFVGSAVVLFNLRPARALVSDTNPHIIRFYNDIKSGYLTPEAVREYLQAEGDVLRSQGEEHFYTIRTRFNAEPNSLDFLFLSRSGFNGMMRFNRGGGFNVPFCRKPDRFRQAYISKIVNQVAFVRDILRTHDWTFQVSDWADTLAVASDTDFVYADPPYAGRHTDYYNQWTETNAEQLLDSLCSLPCGFALSTWLENQYRRNNQLENLPVGLSVLKREHFYHVGPTESLRNPMIEALIVPERHVSSTCAGCDAVEIVE